MNSLSQYKAWMEKHRAEIREDFFHFLRFKSISTDPAYAAEMKKCCDWLKEYMIKHTDLKVEELKTEGYPLIYAEDLRAGNGKETILVYGHYDVQPVDPIELWVSDPFEPTERNGQIFARGALDDKGQIFYGIVALRACKELGIKPPINLKFCIEGEEESASVGLSKSLPKLKHKLKADSLLVIDFGQFDNDHPAITLGARGLLTFEVTLTGSKTDLHSGVHGGMAYNPNKALIQLLSKLWDENGRVAVPGFYDDVEEPSAEDRKSFLFPFTPENYSKMFDIGAIGGEKGCSMFENNCFRPVLEINGIGGGYFGAGFKTVIPAIATAKLSCRIVPKQDPEKLFRHLSDFLKKHVVHGMKIKIDFLSGEPAFRGSLHSKLAKVATQAVTDVTGKSCKNILCGASIPIVAKMIQELGTEVVGIGYGLPSDDIHAPNEHFDMNRFEKGYLTVARILELL